MESALGVNLTKRMCFNDASSMIRLLLNKLPSKDRVERERIFSFFFWAEGVRYYSWQMEINHLKLMRFIYFIIAGLYWQEAI